MNRDYNIMFGRAYDYVQWVLYDTIYCALRNLIATLETQFISVVLNAVYEHRENVFTAASCLSIKLISVR